MHRSPRNPRTSRNPRSTGIVLASCAAATALLAACNPPMPPDVLAARAEAQVVCVDGEVQVSVPESFTGSMDAVGQALAAVCPDTTVLEAAPGEPTAAALVGSVPTADQLTAFSAERCANAPDIAVPAFAYPVSMAYNVPGLEGLVMTPEAIAGILSGQVTSYEDPLIADANPDFDLTGLPPITLLAIEQPQGAVEAMTTWLAKQGAWPSGPTGVVPAATQVASPSDLIAEITATEGAMAVLPVFDAFTNVLATANLPVKGTDANGVEFDTVITADDVQLYKVGSGATELTELEAATGEGASLTAAPAVGGLPTPGMFDLASSKIVLGADQPLVGWPVLGYAHLIVCDGDAGALAFAQYLVRLAGQGALETFGVTPLPEPIRVRTFVPLKVTVATDEPAAS